MREELKNVVVREAYTGSLHLTRATVIVALTDDPPPPTPEGKALQLAIGDNVIVLDLAPDPPFLDDKWCKVRKIGDTEVGYFPILYLRFAENF
jgi:hypothetical protein